MRQSHGNIYLHAQIYTGFMYTAAALCMWSLRAWKIGQNEAKDAEEEKRPEEFDVNVHGRTASRSSEKLKPVKPMKRLFIWKKV